MKPVFILFLFFSFTGFSQEKLNQLDENGKRHGKWKIYLEKNTWKAIEDSTKAEYFRFTYYNRGQHLYPMGPCGGTHDKLIIPEGESKENSGTKILDGEYRWIDEKGRLSSIQVFENGEYISALEYRKTGELEQHFDYTRKAAGQTLGWTVYQYKKDGSLKGSYIFKPENGVWRLIYQKP